MVYIGNDAIIKKCTIEYLFIVCIFLCYIGNLQCIRTVHDMKTESELFDITMIIVLIMYSK